MIKKNLWIVALMAVVAFLFMGCPDNAGDLKSGYKSNKTATDDLIIDDPKEIAALLKAKGYYGADTGGCSTDDNVAIFNLAASPDNFGFELNFPEDAEGYLSLEVTFVLDKVDLLTNGAAKIGFQSAVGADLKPYDDYEIVFGKAVDEKEHKQVFSLNAPNVLPNKQVLFKHNKYGPNNDDRNDPKTGSEAPVNYRLKITKMVFKAGDPVPCCTDCDVATCKDCEAEECTDACGTGCCVIFKGDATTKIEFVKGTTAAADKIVHTNPVLNFSGGTKVSAIGVVTMNNYSIIYYKFPEDTAQFKIADYDYFTITYTLSNIVNSDTVLAYPDADYDASGKAGSANRNKNLKVEFRDYGGVDPFSIGRWDDLGGVGANQTKQKQTWGDNGTNGVAIRMNSWDVNPKQGDGSCAESIDIQITKIEFSKGTRHTVEFFSPMTPANNNFAKVIILNGNTLGDKMPKVTNPGWTHSGWVDDWKSDANEPPLTANTVTATTQIVKDTKLFATWLFIPLPTIAREAAANDTLFTAVGTWNDWDETNYPNAKSKFVFDSKSYWVIGDTRSNNWGTKATAIAQATYDAVKAQLGFTYVRYAITGLETMSPYFNSYTNLVVTYDMIQVAGDHTAIQIRSSNDGGSSTDIIAPNLEAGTGKTFKVPVSAIEPGYFSFVKSGGAGSVMLFRVTKVELVFE